VAKQSQVSFPLTTLSAGSVVGPLTTEILPSTLAVYVVDLSNDESWPASGDVCTILVEQSNDSGNTWALDSSVTLAGGAWKTRAGATMNAIPLSVSFDNAGSATRELRLTVKVIQDCTLGATLSSL